MKRGFCSSRKPVQVKVGIISFFLLFCSPSSSVWIFPAILFCTQYQQQVVINWCKQIVICAELKSELVFWRICANRGQIEVTLRSVFQVIWPKFAQLCSHLILPNSSKALYLVRAAYWHLTFILALVLFCPINPLAQPYIFFSWYICSSI